MDSELKEKGYKLVDLNLGFEDLMVKCFEEACQSQNIQPEEVDIVSRKSVNVYMEYLASLIQREYLTSTIEKETNLKLIPTYSYVRKYFQGSILESHIDRDPCEISLSYCISGPDWDIVMGDNTITTKKGNGVIYRGCDTPHSRPTPCTGDVIQTFSHWVISGGTRLKSAYDNGKHFDFYKYVP